MIDPILKTIFSEIEKLGGKAYFVGGFVRDFILGIDSKDTDIEVFNICYDRLQGLLSEFGKVDLVGKSFGVLKVNIDGKDYDFSLPRRDNKIGISHKDFSVTVDPFMTIEQAAARRDFTINSMSMDINYNIIDPYNGRNDLHYGMLKPTSKAFNEDVLRLIRGFQFSARFNMVATDELKTIALELSKEYHTLPKERIWEEWKKWAIKGKYYTSSLNYLLDTGLHTLYPEISNLIGLEQNPEWHPEGNVFIHTGYVLDAMGQLCDSNNVDDDTRLVLIFAALTHDFGKAVTTEVIDGKITSRNHERMGVPIAEKFLNSIGCPQYIIEKVLPLVREHMAANIVLSDKAIRNLSNRLDKANIYLLSILIMADQFGRPPRPRQASDKVIHLVYRASKLDVLYNKPPMIITGQDLIDNDFVPGPLMGKILKKLYQMQLDGSFSDKEGGLSRIKSFISQL
jgi:tRNA nucleotidyltransferase (CCA-adding enzyme)